MRTNLNLALASLSAGMFTTREVTAARKAAALDGERIFLRDSPPTNSPVISLHRRIEADIDYQRRRALQAQRGPRNDFERGLIIAAMEKRMRRATAAAESGDMRW